MGETADMMLDGTMCQGCGVWLHDGDDGPGFPGFCSSCRRDDRKRQPAQFATPKNHTKVACKVCGRHVKTVGLNDHMRDKHAPGKDVL